jgi:hypothetical protein
METALGITTPSACGSIKIKSVTFGSYGYFTQQVLMIAGYVPSTKVAPSSLGSVMASACGEGMGSRASVERSPPSAGALVFASSHDKSVDFLHQEVLSQQHEHCGK